jgi:hypothetical protein
MGPSVYKTEMPKGTTHSLYETVLCLTHFTIYFFIILYCNEDSLCLLTTFVFVL